MKPSSITRKRLAVRGAVQGVGFRPFVFRLATQSGVGGWVRNTPDGVLIEVEGPGSTLDRFLSQLKTDGPPASHIRSIDVTTVEASGENGFAIQPSNGQGPIRAYVLPDLATCRDCLEEVFEPGNRRYLYPFTNCTQCGPRYTIIRSMPYDRPRTSMAGFRMCEECEAEYRDIGNRRFHAQPNACPKCGPRLELWDREGKILEKDHGALLQTAQVIREGGIAAIKGLGGFHLVADATNGDAVAELRRRKHREEKPFAIMAPGLEWTEMAAEVSPEAASALESCPAPIVLLKVREKQEIDRPVCREVAPGNPYIGVMLPYTPLHHLLMAELGFPIVATSGNLSEEPICTEQQEALSRLGQIADLFLVHDRPIVRPVDDSVVSLVDGRMQILRRARGFAPFPVSLPSSQPATMGYGGQLKATVCLSVGDEAFLSQHIGDLETPQSRLLYEQCLEDLTELLKVMPQRAACDLHPDYVSTVRARRNQPRAIGVQHHAAHVYSCIAEHGLMGPLLGISWDGSGYGEDGTVWGGEFFLVEEEALRRVGTFRSFRLPGSERAVREPRRSALGLLHAAGIGFPPEEVSTTTGQAFTPGEMKTLQALLEKRVHSPQTSSVGRLFDAVASLLGYRQVSHFEGQAAMELQYAAERCPPDRPYSVSTSTTDERGIFVVDWGPMLQDLLRDLADGVTPGRCARRFHSWLTAVILQAAESAGQSNVVLTGGCFQNRLLLEEGIQILRTNGYTPWWNECVPPNDGGIALGQVYGAAISGGSSQWPTRPEGGQSETNP